MLSNLGEIQGIDITVNIGKRLQFSIVTIFSWHFILAFRQIVRVSCGKDCTA